MPRAIDLTKANQQLTSNPLNQLAMSAGQLTTFIEELPAEIAKALEAAITEFLTALDQVTGLNLIQFWNTVETIISSLTTLFGQLNPESGSFDPLGAVQTFLSLVASLGTSLGEDLLGELSSLWGGSGGVQGLIDTLVGGLGGSGTGNTLSTLSGLLTDVPLIGQLLNPSTGSFFPNLIGSLPADLLPSLNIGNLTPGTTNLLKFPNIGNAAEIVGEGIWSYDGTTTVPGASTPGAATVTANAVTQTLYSNIIQVAEGDSINESIGTVWTGLTSSGSPIELVARVYDATQAILDTPVLASVASPGASGSQTLSGSYTVPSGGAFLTLGLRVLGTATAGTVAFGNGSLSKSNQIPGTNVLGLGGTGTIVDSLQALIDGAVGALGGSGTGNPLSALTGLLAAIPGGNVLGLTGGSTIVGDVQQLIDAAFQATNGGTSTGNAITTFIQSLTSQPNTNIVGIQGIPDIGSTAQHTWDQFFNAVTGSNTTGVALSDVANAMQVVSNNAANALALSQSYASTHAPVTQMYSTAGTYTYNIPAWTQVAGAHIDLIGLGGGNGGHGEYGTPYSAGGGDPGVWATRTLLYGTDVPTGTTQLTVVVGAGGSGAGFYWTNGQPGAASTVSTIGGTQLLSAAGGNGFESTVGSAPGGSPGNEVYNGNTYAGGTTVAAGNNGSPPGGGGGGALPFQTTSGNGGDGSVWLVARP